MKLLVRLYRNAPAGLAGIPPDWPADVVEAGDAAPVPAGWQAMTLAEFAAHRQTHQEAYDAWVASETLPAEKAARCAAIDARTQELIGAGFVFAGRRHSLSQNAQNTYTGLYAARDEPVVGYPVRVNTLGDDDTTALAGAEAVRAFYLTAVGTYRAHLDSGTALKDAVRAATTLAEVAAVRDTR